MSFVFPVNKHSKLAVAARRRDDADDCHGAAVPESWLASALSREEVRSRLTRCRDYPRRGVPLERGELLAVASLRNGGESAAGGTRPGDGRWTPTDAARHRRPRRPRGARPGTGHGGGDGPRAGGGSVHARLLHRIAPHGTVSACSGCPVAGRHAHRCLIVVAQVNL
jgi:hypothetical protein